MKLLLPVLLAVTLSGCATMTAPVRGEVQDGVQVTQEGLGTALTSPLRDVNLVREAIPKVLQDAARAPYARPEPLTCARITALILPLNGALGPDLDELVIDETGLGERGGEVALDAIADFASSAIPFRGWVRRLSGAAEHERRVQAAIDAGQARRAYLKGLGEHMKCSAPAAPTRKRTGSRR
ncbi:MAG: hypothetical protein ACKODL_05025 [Phenylobacterium sp.]